MQTFQYKAMDDNGKTVSGTLDAENASEVEESLARRGLIPISVKKFTSGGPSLNFGSLFGKTKPRDVILFTKQFKTLLGAGVSVLKSLEILERQVEAASLKRAIHEIALDIQRGSSLHRSFAKHKEIFPDIYCNMLEAGEISGTLIEVLDRLIYIVEHEYKVKKDIKSALTYPIIVVIALVIAFIVLVVFVLPNFITLFQEAGIELPMPTRVCIQINQILVKYWAFLLIGTGGFFFGIAAWVKTPGGRYFKDRLLLALPVLGTVFTKGAMARFGSIFAILQSSGVSVLDAMNVVSSTIGNEAISREFESLKEQLEQGRGLSEPLSKAKYFTPMIVSMIAIGEETGQLEEMMREVADHYDYEVEYSVSKMSELIGPLLTAGLAVVIGFFALAIFLPLIELMQNQLSGMG